MIPQISIIIPVYNAEKYIKKCIDSILEQTLRNIEIILVNDGSTDKSEEICRAYEQKDNRIKVISQDNKGVSAARNCGISIAKGDFITFVDSDDTIEKDMCRQLYNAAIENKCDIAMCECKVIDNSNTIDNNIECSKIYAKEDACKLFFYDISPFSPNYAGGKIIKRNILNTVKFKEDIFLMEDALFTMEIILNCKNSIVCIDKPLYNYLQRPGSASHSFNKNRITSFYALEELMQIARRINSIYEKEFLKVYSKLTLNILQDIIYYDFEDNKEEYFKISQHLNKRYFINMKSKYIRFKDKIHLCILKTSPKLYKIILRVVFN